MATLFENIVNFRDVSKSVNKFSRKQIMEEGRLYRSARPDNASSKDRSMLTDEFKINTIIDLRTKTELLERDPQIRAGASPESLQIHGINYEYININGSNFTAKLASRLTWYQYGKLAILMLFGYRLNAVNIVGSNIIQPGGLTGLAVDTLDTCGSEISEFLKSLADIRKYPILIHCTQGKDRTGLLVVLVLLLLGMSVDSIKYDYLLSQGNLDIERSARVKELSIIGLSEEFADCSTALVDAVRLHIVREYSSIESYLKSIGVGHDLQNRIKSNLLSVH